MSETECRVLLNETFAINESYEVVLYVIEVPASRKFPIGIKAKFVLLHTEGKYPRLLVDNHEPYGFHMHTHLPEDKNVRVELLVEDHTKALEIFFQEVERIVSDEHD